ncbi:winged helix-turn-helix domain-containing protein [Shewanella woodyi]|uniref:winged helix-turn-helix domain-containing protein n=1 Tax=Shewanella woodyi TaxID=60961 RepID=UPI0007F8C660|nr:crosslink repair DNA glycosylase YcaQ family protein [Shewanella woodyi]
MSSPYSANEWLQLNLQQQGLLTPADSVSKAVEQLSYVQIDSINVVERAHHHVLFNRISDYQTSMLDSAMAKSEIFEYWSHAAAYLPIEDFRFSLWQKQQLKQGGKHWFEPNHKVMREVKAKIAAEGPLKASHFGNTSKAATTGWWDWKPAKRALEQLFMHGDLMVAQRDKFQKVYDLTERVLPSHIDMQLPDDTEFARYLIYRYLIAHGFGTVQQMVYLRKKIKPSIVKTLNELCLAGEVARFTESGLEYFYLPHQQVLTSVPDRVWLLNPFDNLVIQRQRLNQLFGFNYQIEVYVPAAKRQFGYYSLPILWRDRFIGRVDVKAERKQSVLLLQKLTIEEGAFSTSATSSELEEFIAAFRLAVDDYAEFNKCDEWELVETNLFSDLLVNKVR